MKLCESCHQRPATCRVHLPAKTPDLVPHSTTGVRTFDVCHDCFRVIRDDDSVNT